MKICNNYNKYMIRGKELMCFVFRVSGIEKPAS